MSDPNKLIAKFSTIKQSKAGVWQAQSSIEEESEEDVKHFQDYVKGGEIGARYLDLQEAAEEATTEDLSDEALKDLAGVIERSVTVVRSWDTKQ
jgi:hypothetical protein